MRVDVYGLHNALARVVGICGWLGTSVHRVSLPPPSLRHMYFGHFLSFPLTGFYSPRMAAIQPKTASE